MDSFACVVFVIIFNDYFQSVTGQFQIRPENKYAMVGESVVFQCTIDNAGQIGNIQEWKEYITSETGSLISQNDIVQSTYVGRYAIEGTYNLNIENVKLTHAGKYGCNGKENNEVIIQFIVLESDSVLTMFPLHSPVIEGTTVRYWCTIHYRGFWAPQMNWIGPTFTQISHQNESTTTTMQTYIDVIVSSSTNGERFECVTSFGDSLMPTPGENEADNIPSYQLKLSSPSLNVYYSPRNVSIFDESGEILTSLSQNNSETIQLTCVWDSNPDDANVNWIHVESGTTLGNSQNLSVSTDLSMGYTDFNIQCMVSNTLNDELNIIGQATAEISVHMKDNSQPLTSGFTTSSVLEETTNAINPDRTEKITDDESSHPDDEMASDSALIAAIVLGIICFILIIISGTLFVLLRQKSSTPSKSSERGITMHNMPSQYFERDQRPTHTEMAAATGLNTPTTNGGDYVKETRSLPDPPGGTYEELKEPTAGGYMEPCAINRNSKSSSLGIHGGNLTVEN